VLENTICATCPPISSSKTVETELDRYKELRLPISGSVKRVADASL